LGERSVWICNPSGAACWLKALLHVLRCLPSFVLWVCTSDSPLAENLHLLLSGAGSREDVRKAHLAVWVALMKENKDAPDRVGQEDVLTALENLETEIG